MNHEPCVLVYDLEIANAIPEKDRNRTPINQLPGITYCEGWGDHEGMGIAVLGARTLPLGEEYALQGKAPGGDMFRSMVEQADVVVGFNCLGFDHKVVKACWGIEIPEAKTYDLLHEAKLALGGYLPKGGGFTLSDFGRANLGAEKSGHGSDAPIRWQRGEKDAVIDYCLGDVRLTAALWNFATRGAEGATLRGPRLRNPREPEEWLTLRAAPGAGA